MVARPSQLSPLALRVATMGGRTVLRHRDLGPAATGPDTGHFVDVEGMQLFYRKAGSGPPLLLLHGGLATGSLAWRSWYRSLAQHYTVVAPDIRGHGRTDNPAARFLGFGALSWDMIRFMEAIDLPWPTRVIAHSCGALIALHIAAYEPRRVLRQVLIGAQAFIGQSPGYAAALRTTFGARDLDQPPNPLFFFKQNAVDGTALALLHRHTPPWRLFRQIWPMRIRPLSLDAADYAKIAAPTLLLTGDNDTFVSVAESERLAHLLPKGNVRVLPGHDHFSALHDRSVLRKTVEPFLA